EEDGFYYDILRLPDGSATRLNVRSMVGLMPLCAATVSHGQLRRHMPGVVQQVARFLDRHPELTVSMASLHEDGVAGRTPPVATQRDEVAPSPFQNAGSIGIPERLWHSLDVPLPSRPPIC